MPPRLIGLKGVIMEHLSGVESSVLDCMTTTKINQHYAVNIVTSAPQENPQFALNLFIHLFILFMFFFFVCLFIPFILVTYII